MLTTADDVWDQTRHCVESETGMDLSGDRLTRVRDAVAKILDRPNRESTLRSILARPEERSRFVEQLTGQLTVGESFFFRNEQHFRALRERVLPQIQQENSGTREIRVWSAGCATGEEPYSLAILLDQLLGANSTWQVSILGTDLNPDFLRRAQRAEYRQWSFRQTEIHQNRNYFTPAGDGFQLVERVRQRVRFAYLNLVKDVYPSLLTGTVGLDLILFRNVAIYLRPEVTAAILRRFHQALRPGGWLLIGEVEVGGAQPGLFEVRRFEQATFYQKTRDRPLTTGATPLPLPPPVLAPATPSAEFRFPHVPTLPEWGPLPRAGDRRAPAEAEESSPVKSVEVLAWEQVERAMSAERFDQAEACIERLNSNKTRAQVRLRMVRSLLSLAQASLARRMLALCLQEEPLSLEAQLLLAGLAEESGDLAAAEQACRRALYIDPRAAMAHFHLNSILERKGDYRGATRCLDIIQKLIAGKDPHALVEFGEGICYGRLKEMVGLLQLKQSASGNEV